MRITLRCLLRADSLLTSKKSDFGSIHTENGWWWWGLNGNLSSRGKNREKCWLGPSLGDDDDDRCWCCHRDRKIIYLILAFAEIPFLRRPPPPPPVRIVGYKRIIAPLLLSQWKRRSILHRAAAAGFRTAENIWLLPRRRILPEKLCAIVYATWKVEFFASEYLETSSNEREKKGSGSLLSGNSWEQFACCCDGIV